MRCACSAHHRCDQHRRRPDPAPQSSQPTPRDGRPRGIDHLSGELFFEDFEPGQVYELGSHAVTEEEIVEFARRFDPQPFHVDPEAAAESVFGGLIASGWHTGAMWMRLYVGAVLAGAASRGSPGIEELRWLAPVRPGDTLSGRLTVLQTTASATKPDRGTVRIRGEMVNQDGVTVMAMTSRGHFGRRESA